MDIDDKTVRRIAELARIDLQDDADAGGARGYIDDLEAILALVERMNAVPTDGVEPLAHPIDVTQPLRPDAVTERDRRQTLQAAAPAVEAGLFLVPRVLE